MSYIWFSCIPLLPGFEDKIQIYFLQRNFPLGPVLSAMSLSRFGKTFSRTYSSLTVYSWILGNTELMKCTSTWERWTAHRRRQSWERTSGSSFNREPFAARSVVSWQLHWHNLKNCLYLLLQELEFRSLAFRVSMTVNVLSQRRGVRPFTSYLGQIKSMITKFSIFFQILDKVKMSYKGGGASLCFCHLLTYFLNHFFRKKWNYNFKILLSSEEL